MSIAGYPATYEERYDPSSAYILRLYTFFTEDHRIEISVGYDIGDLYTEEYERREQSGESVSLSALVAEDIGENFDEPYDNIVSIFPFETYGMVRFFAEANAMIGSMN